MSVTMNIIYSSRCDTLKRKYVALNNLNTSSDIRNEIVYFESKSCNITTSLLSSIFSNKNPRLPLMFYFIFNLLLVNNLFFSKLDDSGGPMVCTVGTGCGGFDFIFIFGFNSWQEHFGENNFSKLILVGIPWFKTGELVWL